MTTAYKEQQAQIIYNLIVDASRGDTSTIAELTDNVGLSPNEFTDLHYRTAYKSFQELFINSQNSRAKYTIDAAWGGIEEQYRTNGHAEDADQLMQYWTNRAEVLSGAQLADPLSAAAMLMRANIREQFGIMSQGFEGRVRKADNPAAELADIAAEINMLASSHGEQALSYKQELVQAAQAKPISCGNVWMDEHLFWNKLAGAGGFAPTMMISWFAPSENGKTSTATTFATSWISRGYPCIMLTAEESRTNFAIRIANAYTGLPVDTVIEAIPHLYTGEELTETQGLISGALDFMDKKLFTYEITDLDSIERYVRRHRTQFGSDVPMLVLVDHIGATDTGQGNWSRDLEQSAKRLSNIALRYNVTMVVFGQASGNMEDEFKEKNYTTNKDMRGTRGVRQWSDYVVASCRHNGAPLPGYTYDAFYTATVVQSIKNRFRDDSRGIINWGVFDFDVLCGTISNRLITDDWKLQVEIWGDD